MLCNFMTLEESPVMLQVRMLVIVIDKVYIEQNLGRNYREETLLLHKWGGIEDLLMMT